MVMQTEHLTAQQPRVSRTSSKNSQEEFNSDEDEREV